MARVICHPLERGGNYILIPYFHQDSLRGDSTSLGYEDLHGTVERRCLAAQSGRHFSQGRPEKHSLLHQLLHCDPNGPTYRGHARVSQEYAKAGTATFARSRLGFRLGKHVELFILQLSLAFQIAFTFAFALTIALTIPNASTLHRSWWPSGSLNV